MVLCGVASFFFGSARSAAAFGRIGGVLARGEETRGRTLEEISG